MSHRRGPGVRRYVQAAFLGLVLVIGAQFSIWAFAHLDGRATSVGRPPGVEGFLPISALMSLRLWLGGGGIHPVHPAGLAILLGAMLASLLVPRAFCSHICPVGAVSELAGDLGRRLLGRLWRLPRWLDVSLRCLKYLLLAFFVWATWIAMELPSLQGFLGSPYNKVADVKMLLFFAEPSRLTIGVVAALVVASVLVRDAWCRYLCPYGALLGLAGWLAPLKVDRDAAICTQCQACTRACPARIPVDTATRVRHVECSGCEDCVAACPVADCLAVRLPSGRGRAVGPVVVVGVVVVVFLAVLGAFRLTGHWRSGISETEYAERLRDIGSPAYGHPDVSPPPRTPKPRSVDD